MASRPHGDPLYFKDFYKQLPNDLRGRIYGLWADDKLEPGYGAEDVDSATRHFQDREKRLERRTRARAPVRYVDGHVEYKRTRG